MPGWSSPRRLSPTSGGTPVGSGGVLHASKILTVAALAGLFLALDRASAAEAPGGGEDALARLNAALAAEETREGKTSPYLLPLLEEIARVHWREGALDRAASERRRALDIAVTRFGCDSPSAA